MEYSEQECIDALMEAAQEVGHSPSATEYKSLDISPCLSTILNVFDSWNCAKESADLETVTRSDATKPIQSPPDNMEISREKWEDFSPNRRYKHRRRAKWAKVKCDKGCNECGYDDHPSALDFHHTEPSEKSESISTMINTSSPAELEREVEKCEVLCANCHRKKKGDYFNG